MARFLFYDDKVINLLLKDEKPSGGAAVQAYGWMRGLIDSGHEVLLMTNLNHLGPLKENVNSITLIPEYDVEKGIRWLRWIYYRLPYIYRNIKSTNPDYLYQGIPGWNSFLIGLVCLILNVKFIQRISNDNLVDERIYRNFSKTHGFFLRLGLKLSYCILCQNDYQYNIIKSAFPEKKVFKISNPYFFESSVKAEGDSKKYIAWLGLFQYQKNLGLLYEIASILDGEQFIVAGKEIKKIDKDTLHQIERLKQLPNVRFAGFLQRKDVLPFLANSKFLLNTSHYEGFSNTFLEAMAVGTPIITYEKVNPDAIISKFNLGIVYKDAIELKSKYCSLTPAEYKTMSKNTLRYIEQHHDHKALAKELLHLLHLEVNETSIIEHAF